MTPLDLEPGARIDRYRLERRLGEGSFAEVWLAIEEGQRGFSKRVALKILRPDAAKDAEVLGLLTQEARLCAMLHHPGLVGVYGVESSGQYTFVVMEYVDGVTLNQLDADLREAGLVMPTSVILDLGIGVCEALDHAHNAVDHSGTPLALVHRDMKPGNVMLSRLGVVKITDFGLAKASTSTIETQDGMLRGTPLYVAPEIWNGSRDFRPTMDLFALGAILWELGVGQKMLAAPDLVGIIGMAINGSADGDVQRLRLSRPALGPALAGLLERDTGERTPTAWLARKAMVEVRHEMAAPGGLDLFMALAAPLLGGRGISDRRLREVPPTADPHWLALLEAASEAGVSVSSTAAPIPTIRDVEPPSIAEPSPTRLVPVAPSGSLTVAAPRARISTAGRITLMALGFGVLLLMVAVFAVQRSRSADPTDSTDPDSAPSAPREPTVAPAPEWTPEPPDPTAAPVEEPAPSATPASVPATSPGPEPRPSPRPTRSPEPPVEPSPSPVTSPAEPVPVAPVDGCLALVSSPPGGRIWLDGQAMAEHASSSGVEVAHAPGSVGISMGISDVATASVEVAIRPGERSTVRCDLLAHTCRVVPGGACP